MILLSSIISEYQDALRTKYHDRLLPGHLRALGAMVNCRTDDSLFMIAQCQQCDHQSYHPHSCGHRMCPHCQHHEGQQWLERQRKKLLPADYFMITFTLPAQFRSLAWHDQRRIYAWLFKVAWETLKTFGLNDKSLQGNMGATGVLHTHSRALDFHPHVHFIVPAGAVDSRHRLWRKKEGRYLFKEKNLAMVFRAKWFDEMKKAGISVAENIPVKWKVNCQHVGRGDKALTYLGKYLYRGVLSEKNIIIHREGNITFRYTDNKKMTQTRTLPAVDFLWLLLKHVLPRGFRRARDYGFLHANCKRMIQLIQYALHSTLSPSVQPVTSRPNFCCSKCGSAMKIIATRVMHSTISWPLPVYT